MGTFINTCALKPQSNFEDYYPGLSHCEKRFVLHCWHVLPGKELPVCCWCKTPAELPKASCLLEENLFWALVSAIKRNTQSSTAAPIAGCSMIWHQDYQTHDSTIEIRNLESGVGRLYGKGGPSFLIRNAYDTMARHLRMFRIVERNIEVLQSGEIKKRYREEALEEIQNQLWFLPKKEAELVSKTNPENAALARKAARLKSQLTRKKIARKRRDKGGVE